MQLIIILLATVSILTFLSGVITFFGAKKGDRARSAWFLAAAFFATVWMISISIFLTAGVDREATIDWHTKWIFISAIFIDISFLGYVAWNARFGKILTYIFMVLGGAISLVILLWPHHLYYDVVLSSAGNSVDLNIGPLYFAYIGFFCLIVPAIVIYLLRESFSSRSSRKKGGNITIMVTFAISSVLIVISDLILPFFGNWSLSWIGPLALSITIIAFYYTILRYRSLNLSSIWLKIFSYIVIIASLAIIYMIIFSLIFAALFRGSTPSIEVIILNFIMIVIFILLMPAMSQIAGSIRNIIMEQTPKRKGK